MPLGSDADTHLGTSSPDLGLVGSTVIPPFSSLTSSAPTGPIMGMVGTAVHASGNASPFQYVSCSLPATGPVFSSLVYDSDASIVQSLSVYRGSSQHIDHLVEEPSDVESESNGGSTDNDDGSTDDSTGDDEHVDESVSPSPATHLGPEPCMILQ